MIRAALSRALLLAVAAILLSPAAARADDDPLKGVEYSGVVLKPDDGTDKQIDPQLDCQLEPSKCPGIEIDPPEATVDKLERTTGPDDASKIGRLSNGIETWVERRSAAGSPPPSPEQAKKLQQIDETLRRLNELAKQRFPNDPQAYSRSARQALREGRSDRALADAKEALLRGAKDAMTYSIFAAASYHLGDFQTASHAAALALQADPSSKEALAVARLSHARIGDAGLRMPQAGGPKPAADEAGPSPVLRAATPAAQEPAGPSSAQKAAAFVRHAGSAFELKDYGSAHDLASQATDQEPGNVQAWNLRAFADLRRKRYDDAAQEATTALGLSPGNPQSLQARGWAFARRGMYREALADADAALERDPYNGFQYQSKAYALAGLGDRKGAIESLRRAAERDPQFTARFEQALQASQPSDLLLLFDERAAARAPAPWMGERRRTRARLALWTGAATAGFILLGLGLRSALGGRAPEAAQA